MFLSIFAAPSCFTILLQTKGTICQCSTLVLWPQVFMDAVQANTVFRKYLMILKLTLHAISRPPIWSTAMLWSKEINPSDTHINYYEKMKLSMFFELQWRSCDWSWPCEEFSGYCDRYITTIFKKEQLVIVLWDWESFLAQGCKWLLAAEVLEAIRTTHLVLQLRNSDQVSQSSAWRNLG
jgi:hypothetical protein